MSKILYIAADEYFPEIEEQIGGKFVVMILENDLNKTTETMCNATRNDRTAFLRTYNKFRDSLKRRKWNKFKQMSPAVKEKINTQITLYAIYRRVRYGQPIKLLYDLPNNAIEFD